MTFKAFEEIKATLKDKWLDYYEANQVWIDSVVDNQQVRAFLILGSITVIEPRLQEYLPLFHQLNNKPNDLIKVMGLDFNPSSELEIRKEERSKAKAEESKKKAESANTCYKYQDELSQD